MSPQTGRASETRGPDPQPLSWKLCCRACGTCWSVSLARILADLAWMDCPVCCRERPDRGGADALPPYSVSVPMLVGVEPAFRTQIGRARAQLRRMELTHREAGAQPRSALAAALCHRPGIGPMTAALVLVILDLGDSALLAVLFAPRTVSRPSPGLTPRQRAVLTLAVQKGVPVPQLAAQLGLTSGRIRTLQRSGTARLRRMLHELQQGHPLTDQAHADLTAFGPRLALTVPEQTVLQTRTAALRGAIEPVVPSSEWPDSPGARTYQRLIDQSAEARRRGNHWRAQQLVSIAHRWAMAERTRLQRLSKAQEEFAGMTVQLQRAWDRDRSCATVADLRARHPEFRGTIGRWETAQQQVRMLEAPTPPAADVT